MKLAITAVAFALYTLGVTAVYAGGCAGGYHDKEETTKVEPTEETSS